MIDVAKTDSHRGRAQVDRRSRLSRAEFRAEYLGMGRPVVITDLTGDWPARDKWTFAFFRETYGNDEIRLHEYDPMKEFTPDNVRLVRLSEHIDAAITKEWEDYPFYMRDNWRLLDDHPELKSDYTEAGCFFDWFQVVPKSLRMPYPRIFIGPKGAITPLHVDVWRTHAWLSQLVGRKRWLLFPPGDEKLIYDCSVRVEAPDLSLYPDYSETEPLETTIGPGDTIFVPSGWAHWVVSLDPAISLTANYMGPGCIASCLGNLSLEFVQRIGAKLRAVR